MPRNMSEASRERQRAYDRKRYAETRDTQRERHKEYHAKNKARVLARHKARREGPEGDVVRALGREIYHRRAELAKQHLKDVGYKAQKKWKKANPIKMREYTRRRAALERSSGVFVDYDKILRESDGLCGICKKPIMVYDEINFDHIIPLARGGQHVPGNIQVAHRFCNESKGASLPEEVMANAS